MRELGLIAGVILVVSVFMNDLTVLETWISIVGAVVLSIPYLHQRYQMI